MVETYLANTIIDPGNSVQQSEQNIVVYAQDVSHRRFQGVAIQSLIETKGDEVENVFNNDFSVQPETSQVSLTMPRTLFENLNIDAENQRVSFVIYRRLSLFQTDTDIQNTTGRETIKKLNSWVVSGSVSGQKLENLADPIVTTYKPLKNGLHEKTVCVFWDFSLNNGLGNWSRAGCSFTGIKDGIVTCNCFHLTNFAILTVRTTT